MDEFSLIELLTSSLGATRGAVAGVGDDGAILDVPGDRQLVVSTDTLVRGVHFEAGAPAADIGYKSLAVNLSDLAAMGAEPAWYFLALTLPEFDAGWVREFAGGMKGMADAAGIRIAGGDTTRGPLSVTVTVCGLVPRGEGLLRSGARVGDVIAVSGPTGLAARAVKDMAAGAEPSLACLQALRRTVPRLELGRGLRGLAHSCIDISDGLMADLGHIAVASGVGAVIELGQLPVPPALADLPDEDRWDLQLGGGDDYELCFTADRSAWHRIEDLGRRLGVTPCRIGTVIEGEGCTCVTPGGGTYQPASPGYVHGGGR